MSETKNINSQEEKDLELYDVYELGYHILPTVPESELEDKVNEIRELIKQFGGEFIMEGEPELIDLAYTMIVPRGGHNDKYDKAYFGWIKFEAPKANVPELQKELKLNQNILRFILFKTVKEDTRAQIKLPELKEVKTTGTVEQKPETEEAEGEVSDESLDKALEEIESEAEAEAKEGE